MNVGIVLSGGMAKGAYQIGALKAISEMISMDDIKCISCASIGALNGYSYIMNRLDEAEQMYLDLCMDESKLFVNQVLRGNTLQNDIKRICCREDVVDKEFYITLLNMSNKKLEYRNLYHENSGNVRKILKASVAMPICNKAVLVEDDKYFDGAMIDNIPIYPLLDKSLDFIICIYFDEEFYLFENQVFDEKVLKITFPAKNVLKESMVFKQYELERNIEQGYRHTHSLLWKVLPDGANTKDIRHRIGQYNGKNERQMRITGEMMVTNLNRVLQKFVRREIEV